MCGGILKVEDSFSGIVSKMTEHFKMTFLQLMGILLASSSELTGFQPINVGYEKDLSRFRIS